MTKDVTRLPGGKADSSGADRAEGADAAVRPPDPTGADWSAVAVPAGALPDDRFDGPAITLPPDSPLMGKPSLVACPYLGIAEDPPSHFMLPDEAHHCFGLKRDAYIPRAQQATTCLTPAYRSCVVFIATERGEPISPPWGERRKRSQQGWLGRIFGKK